MKVFFMISRWIIEEYDFLNKIALIMIVKGSVELIASQSLFMLSIEKPIDNIMEVFGILCGIYLIIKAKNVEVEIVEEDHGGNISISSSDPEWWGDDFFTSASDEYIAKS